MTSRGELDYLQQATFRNRADVELDELILTDELAIPCARSNVSGWNQCGFIFQPKVLLLGRHLEYADDVSVSAEAINVQAARAVPANELAPRAGRGGEHADIAEAHWEQALIDQSDGAVTVAINGPNVPSRYRDYPMWIGALTHRDWMQCVSARSENFERRPFGAHRFAARSDSMCRFAMVANGPSRSLKRLCL